MTERKHTLYIMSVWAFIYFYTYERLAIIFLTNTIVIKPSDWWWNKTIYQNAVFFLSCCKGVEIILLSVLDC